MGEALGRLTGTTQGIAQTADAAQGAAQAQFGELQRAMALTRTESEAAIREAGPSISELRALEGSISGQERNLARQERLIKEMDPVILEASQQVLALLRGEEAKSIAPLKRERERQRQALVNRLRNQLGPGAETSTAGIQALNQFDEQTSAGLNQAQQSGIQQLGQTANVFGSQNRLGQGFATLAGLGQARGSVNQRQADTRLRALQPRLQAGLALAGGAGAEFVGQQIRGAGRIKQGEQALEFGSQLLASGAEAVGAPGGKPPA